MSAGASRLLATTALVTFAGAAAAEVAISGSGRMGMVYDQSIANSDVVIVNNEAERVSDAGFRFDSRVRIAFTLTQETDSGVTFGGSVRADNASAGNNGRAGSVFMTGAFGKIAMGDVDGAAEAAVGNLSGVGYTGLGDFNEAFYLQQSNSDLDSNEQLSAFALPAALYEYNTGAAAFYVSIGNPGGIAIDDDTFAGAVANTVISDTVIDSAYGLGAKYSVDNYSVGIGYESIDISGIATNRGADRVLGVPSNAVNDVVRDQIAAGPDQISGNRDDLTGDALAAALAADAAEFPEALPLGAASDDVVTEFNTNIDSWILGGSATFGGFTLKAQYGQGSGNNLDLTQYGISGDYTFDAFTVTAFWRSIEIETAGDTAKAESQPFGFGVSYDLGGGAIVQAGVVDPDRFDEDYRADIGVNFNF